LPHINIYIKIYQFNKIFGKGVGLQVRKLSYSPTPVQIINNQVDMATLTKLYVADHKGNNFKNINHV